jgi:hypothetical protein
VELLLSTNIFSVTLLKQVLMKDEFFLVDQLGFDPEDSLDIRDALDLPSLTASANSQSNDSSFVTDIEELEDFEIAEERDLEDEEDEEEMEFQRLSRSSSRRSLHEKQQQKKKKQQSLLAHSYIMNEITYLKIFTPSYNYSPNEIAILYYSAAQCQQKESKKELFHIASRKGGINGKEDGYSGFSITFAEGYIMRCYLLGQAGIDKNLEIASQIGQKIFRKLRKGIKTEKKKEIYLNSLFLIAVCYEYGLGCIKNEKKAFEYYLLAAKCGFSIAQAFIGYLYMSGDASNEMGISRDITEALKYFSLAAAQGHAAGQINLGICYEYGIGLKTNPKEAVKFYQLAASQGGMTFGTLFILLFSPCCALFSFFFLCSPLCFIVSF